MAKSQFAKVSGRTVCQYIATSYRFTRHHTWTLVDTSILVRTGVLSQVVDVDTRFARDQLFFVHFDYDTRSVN
ncbi:Uncharacterised protein [Vibrio cholerae]|nr:Uncharacterised protein [Vibrio cholerae]